MKRTVLLLEHRHGKSTLKKLRLNEGGRPTVIGSSPKSDLRLPGSDVSSFHAVIECRNGRWFVFDFGSQTGTWVNGETILENEVDGTLVVKIGTHELVLTTHLVGRDLFASSFETDSPNNLTHHQVVVRTEKGVLETHFAPRDTQIKVRIGGEDKLISLPQSANWVTDSFGKVIVQSRLVAHPGVAPTGTEELPKSTRAVVGTGILMSLIGGLLMLAPWAPEDPKLIPEMKNNAYTSLIYDAKVLSEKKKQSQKITQTKFTKTAAGSGSSGSSDTREIPKGKAATKLISSIKATNLSALIGKVAKRASLNANIVQAAGKTVDEGGAGRAVAGITTGTIGNQIGVESGQGYKLKGVGTEGKGGGGNYKSGTGLGLGGTGSADVGVVEEESEISGGLDREIIAEVIRSNIGQIRYCYERQLSANPDLYGKVAVKFTIGSTGLVETQQVGTTTLNNADVEGCILRRVARWKFPQPKGGTSVLVTYPFLLKSTN